LLMMIIMINAYERGYIVENRNSEERKEKNYEE